ncbi:uncharacterized protein LOC111597764 isoform X2 [Drosophila hydei]|uniref:Uncharacterized protein LOC111597764 isoform X2 n=1 Tax=Drosophila hydei TaxID=7224 RepID=A0A6J1LWM7_DROHY|nr:uncharacterized protein LOC111597764 isoform X2 [Drosophila hydei]XP_030080654.1 uncharacterized protein LOC111597764 isoform X2 [Drosophila hydei]
MELIRKYKQGKLTTGDVRNLNHIVICLMVLVAIFSILWSVSLHMLSGDFNEGIISAKIMFKDRDYGQMNEKSKGIIEHDLQQLGRLPYEFNETPQPLKSDSQTKRPKYKFEHIYETKDNAPLLARLVSDQERAQEDATTTTNAPPKVVPNAEADLKFLASQSVDTHATRWSRGIGAQFVYAFPLISEIVAIIWTAMCLIYQTGSKKTSVLPKPWRIVVPSIAIFALMSLGSVAYTILTNGYLRRLCGQLRQGLTNPWAISCGDAIALLRPRIHEHSVAHDAYLDLFRCSYNISMVLWFLALLIMMLRYIFAIDFQLVDIDDMFDRPQPIQPVYTEVQQSSPQHTQQLRPRSEDDFQSAKSRLSEMAMPLLDSKGQEQQQQQTHLTTVA